jgi:hypothetical protein
MPRIELKSLFEDGKAPEGLDIEQTESAIDKRVEELLEAERSGVRSSVDTEINKIKADLELKEAELEDLRSGKSGTTGGDPTSATEPGSKAAAVRAAQAKAQAEADRQAAIDAAVQGRDAFWAATLEAKEAGIPDDVIELSEGSASELKKLTVMYQKLGGSTKTNDKKPATGINPGGDDQPAGEQGVSSLERVQALVSKMPAISGPNG